MGGDAAALTHITAMQDIAGVFNISRRRKPIEEIATGGGTLSIREKRPGVVALGST
jgi:hypothetical protein